MRDRMIPIFFVIAAYAILGGWVALHADSPPQTTQQGMSVSAPIAPGGLDCSLHISQAGRVTGQCATPTPSPTATPSPSPTITSTATASPTGTVTPSATPSSTPPASPSPTPAPTLTPTATPSSAYPWHTQIVATTFWVAEPQGNGSSENNAITAYDSEWLQHYGCDENAAHADSVRRLPPTYFPAGCTPLENPFFLDLPVDDLNNAGVFGQRCQVIPWALQIDPAGANCGAGNNSQHPFSYIKNRWVELTDAATGRTCAGQVEDAGPYIYNDIAYVFGTTDTRPRSTRANNAGLDVSPALRDCLGFHDLNGDTDVVNWRFVDQPSPGPWTIVITTSGVTP